MTYTQLTCRAEHPEARRGNARFKGRVCGSMVQMHPWVLKATGRILERFEEVECSSRRICLGIRCPKCGMITEYEIVSTETQVPEGTPVVDRDEAEIGAANPLKAAS